jgi:hypothetical protein
LSAKFGETRVLSFIDGLANTDVTSDHVEQMLEQLQAAARGESCPDVTWVCLDH